MMFDLSTLFKPIISTPNENSEKYVEILPCDILKPYIKCFWGTHKPCVDKATVSSTLIPEACMDIIRHVNYSTNETTQEFYGTKDAPYLPNAENRSGMISTAFA